MTLTCLLLLAVPGAAPPVVQEWGTIKGKVVFAGDKIPENPKVTVTSDRKVCLSKGPISKDELVIDAKTKGVRWVRVWLAPVDDFRNVKKASIPNHPSLKMVPKEAFITAPCCVCEPRMLVMREGTTLVCRNNGKIGHNIVVGPNVPAIGRLVPPGKDDVISGIKAFHVPAAAS